MLVTCSRSISQIRRQSWDVSVSSTLGTTLPHTPLSDLTLHTGSETMSDRGTHSYSGKRILYTIDKAVCRVRFLFLLPFSSTPVSLYLRRPLFSTESRVVPPPSPTTVLLGLRPPHLPYKSRRLRRTHYPKRTVESEPQKGVPSRLSGCGPSIKN